MSTLNVIFILRMHFSILTCANISTKSWQLGKNHTQVLLLIKLELGFSVSLYSSTYIVFINQSNWLIPLMKLEGHFSEINQSNKLFLQTQRTDLWTRRGGEGGVNWEIRFDINILPCVTQIASGNLLYSRGSSAQCSVMTQMGGMGLGGGPRGRGYMYTYSWFTSLYSRN